MLETVSFPKTMFLGLLPFSLHSLIQTFNNASYVFCFLVSKAFYEVLWGFKDEKISALSVYCVVEETRHVHNLLWCNIESDKYLKQNTQKVLWGKNLRDYFWLIGLEYVRESFMEKCFEKYMSRYKWGKMLISKGRKRERGGCIPGSGTWRIKHGE